MKQHPYYKHIYVSTDGKVYSDLSGKIKELTQTETQFGYLDASVSVGNGNSIKKRVHRLVAETYLPNPLLLREVDHIDCNKKNNNLENLEWVSSKENKRRARLNGLYDNTIGENHHNAILTEDIVHSICKCLQDGMRNKDVSELFGIHKDLISHIKIGDLWRPISSQYIFRIKRTNRKSSEFIHKVCQAIKEGYNNREIHGMFNREITIHDVQRIRAKNIHTKISDSYF
jgi:hypothetical protein